MRSLLAPGLMLSEAKRGIGRGNPRFERALGPANVVSISVAWGRLIDDVVNERTVSLLIQTCMLAHMRIILPRASMRTILVSPITVMARSQNDPVTVVLCRLRNPPLYT